MIHDHGAVEYADEGEEEHDDVGEEVGAVHVPGLLHFRLAAAPHVGLVLVVYRGFGVDAQVPLHLRQPRVFVLPVKIENKL